MTRNLKIFLVIVLLSLPFWWVVNILEKNLEDFFYSWEMEKNPPSILIAQIAQNYIVKTSVIVVESRIPEDFEITAESAISVEIDDKGNERILFSKKEAEKMPMASISKLMTALIASEFYYPSLKVQISKTAVGQEEEFGNLNGVSLDRTAIASAGFEQDCRTFATRNRTARVRP